MKVIAVALAVAGSLAVAAIAAVIHSGKRT